MNHPNGYLERDEDEQWVETTRNELQKAFNEAKGAAKEHAVIQLSEKAVLAKTVPGIYTCEKLLEGNRAPVSLPCWPPERRRDVMERVQSLPEGRIQRDILTFNVPP